MDEDVNVIFIRKKILRKITLFTKNILGGRLKNCFDLTSETHVPKGNKKRHRNHRSNQRPYVIHKLCNKLPPLFSLTSSLFPYLPSLPFCPSFLHFFLFFLPSYSFSFFPSFRSYFLPSFKYCLIIKVKCLFL